MHSTVNSFAVAVFLLCGAASRPAQSDDSTEAKHAGNLPIMYVPAHPEPSGSPVWRELEALEFDKNWAGSDSVSTALIAELGAAANVDSLDYAYALAYLGNSLIKRRMHTDPRGWGSVEAVVGIRERIAGPGDPLAIWARLLGATSYTEGGHPELARAHAEAALAVLEGRESIDHSWTSQAHLGLATALTAQRDYDAAQPEFEVALRDRELADGPNSHLLVAPLAEYGALLTRMGDFDQARSVLERAVRVAEANGPGGDLLTGSLSRLSTLENRVGNVAESLELAQRAYAIARVNFGDHDMHTVYLRTIISYRLLSLGDWAGGAELLEGIVADMDAALGATHHQTINARIALLEALIELRDLEGATRELETLRPMMVAQDPLANSNWTYFLQLEADLQLKRGDVDLARRTLLEAIGIERRKEDPVGEREGELLTRLLGTIRDTGDRALAVQWCRRVDNLSDSTVVRATEVWPRLVLARAGAEARAGFAGLAFEHALMAEELGRERFSYEVMALPDARALYVAGRLGEACELLVGLVRPGDSDAIEEVWDRVVHWRGLVRHEISHRRLPAESVSAEAAIAHAEWVAAQRSLAQLAVSGMAHPEDPQTRDRYEEARRAAEETERQYVRLASGTVPPAAPVGLGSSLQLLQPGQALVAYVVGSGADGEALIGAFVADASGARPRWIPMGPLATVEAAVRAWTRALGSPGSAVTDIAALGTKVRDLIWRPVELELGDATGISIVPEGVLYEVPWLALPGTQSEYLVEDSRNLRILAAERDLAPADEPGAAGLLALGGPDFDRGVVLAESRPAAPSRAWRCLDGDTLALPPLPFAAAEAEDVAGQWKHGAGDVVLLVGGAATESAFKSAAPGREVIHIATHGILVDAECVQGAEGSRGVGGVQPVTEDSTSDKLWIGRRVWLALAGANRTPDGTGDENEGLLTAEEVVLMDLRGTDWVVLSACQSGLAEPWAREGALGMQRAFQLAGARAVIASHWSIGDESTLEWMQALYAARARGSGAGAAVTEASREVLEARRADGRSTHPFYWAAFTASGD